MLRETQRRQQPWFGHGSHGGLMDMGIGIHVYGGPSHVHGSMPVPDLKGLGVARRINSYPWVQWGMTTWVQASSVHGTKYHEQCGDKRFHEAKQF